MSQKRTLEKCKINDCHIHVGDSKDVNRSVDYYQLQKHIFENKLDKVLILGSSAEDNAMVKSFAHENENIYGLQWLKSPLDNITIDNKIIGCKYHGAYIGKPINGNWWKILEALNQIGGILMVHCGRYKDGSVESNTSFIHALKIAKFYTGIKVIMAHMGGTDTNICKHAILYSKDYDNVYFDTSGITTPYIIEYACQMIPSTRILFGSDVPWCSYNAMYNTVLDARISDEDKKNIFYNSFNDLVSKCEYLKIM